MSTDPDAILQMVGLGSCVGVFLTVPGVIGAAAHVLLPERHNDRAASPGKYADTAIDHLLSLITSRAVDPARLGAHLAGGAQVFSFGGSRPELDIGGRNDRRVRELLFDRRIPILSTDTGGRAAKTAMLEVGSGTFTVRTNQPTAASA